MRHIKQSCCAHGTSIEVWVGSRGIVLLIQMILSRTSSFSFSLRCLSLILFLALFLTCYHLLSLSFSDQCLSFPDNPLTLQPPLVTMLLIHQARHSHLSVLQLNKESCAPGLLHAQTRATGTKDRIYAIGIYARTRVRDTDI